MKIRLAAVLIAFVLSLTRIQVQVLATPQGERLVGPYFIYVPMRVRTFIQVPFSTSISNLVNVTVSVIFENIGIIWDMDGSVESYDPVYADAFSIIYLNGSIAVTPDYSIFYPDTPPWYYELPPGSYYNVTLVGLFDLPVSSAELYIGLRIYGEMPTRVFFSDSEPLIEFFSPLAPLRLLNMTVKYCTTTGCALVGENQIGIDLLFDYYCITNVRDEKVASTLSQIVNKTILPFFKEGISLYEFEVDEYTIDFYIEKDYFFTYNYVYISFSIDYRAEFYIGGTFAFVYEILKNPPRLAVLLPLVRGETYEFIRYEADELPGLIFADGYLRSRGLNVSFKNLTIPWIVTDGVSTYTLQYLPDVFVAGFNVTNPVNTNEPMPNAHAIFLPYTIYAHRAFSGGKAIGYINALYSNASSSDRRLGFNPTRSGRYDLTLYTAVIYSDDPTPSVIGYSETYFFEIKSSVLVKEAKTTISFIPLNASLPLPSRIVGPPTSPYVEVTLRNLTVRSPPVLRVLPNATIVPVMVVTPSFREQDNIINIEAALPVAISNTSWGFSIAYGSPSIEVKASEDEKKIFATVEAPALIVLKVPYQPILVRSPDNGSVAFISVPGSSYLLAFNASKAGTYEIHLATIQQPPSEMPTGEPSPPPPPPSPPVSALPAWWTYAAVAVIVALLVVAFAAKKAASQAVSECRKRKFVKPR